MTRPRTGSIYFNPRPHEECDYFFYRSFGCGVYFNPRTHEECDATKNKEVLSCIISIHALTRSATGWLPNGFVAEFDFNPRTHEECDATKNKEVLSCIISIHALPRSATGWLPNGFVAEFDFNPRTHEECDGQFADFCHSRTLFQSTHSRGVRPNDAIVEAKDFIFQSTHSRGVRLSPPLTIVNYIHFNPRTHEECDDEK